MFVTSAFLFLYYWNLSIKQVHLSCQYINNLTQFQTMKKSISLLLLSLLMITPSCQKPKEVTNEYNIVPQPNQLVHCQQVDKLVDILYRGVMAANVQHQSAMYKAGSVFDLYSRNRPVGFLLQFFSVNSGRKKLINSLYTIEKSVRL